MKSKPSHHLRISPLIPLKLCETLQSFLIEEEKDLFKILTCNVENLQIFRDLLPSHNPSLEVMEITQEEFKHHLSHAQAREAFEEISHQISQNEDLAIQKMLDFILQESIRLKASDIHIENTPSQAQIRIRVDSIMQELFCLDMKHFALLSSSLKLECSLDIHENRKPQDGRFSRNFDQKNYDFRFSSLPTAKGESLVIRILCKEMQSFSLLGLGFPNDLHIDFPHGLVFITGPTGSGKSTTLYAMLEHIKSIEKKIITLEDPIEYDLELLTQVAICEKYGFGFSEALRSILRQDPDVIMVGEIRDQESLSLAIQASLTGHLVLSTLHTNDAPSTIERLLDMRAKPYLIASILRLIIAQRLVRKLCPHCKIPSTIPPPPTIPPQFLTHTFYQAQGCPKCNFKGFNGRILLYEILPISRECKTLIASRAPKKEFLELLEKEGFISLFEYGIKQASLGLTSIEEILRVSQ